MKMNDSEKKKLISYLKRKVTVEIEWSDEAEGIVVVVVGTAFWLRTFKYAGQAREFCKFYKLPIIVGQRRLDKKDPNWRDKVNKLEGDTDDA